ncbi:MAG TPA: hypothetical protein DD723_04470 [Candidatus Omnitrophica bacterium]|nr:MAG: hypothetical protein A2Z81_03970 [Omnitrophica WOR_2 bacterium GWA2_45_18]HBR14784.1 hypothetical protein [Candidatus Omnitrophota bacterium]
MKKNILLAFALTAVLAVPAFASVQNVKVSGNIDSLYLYRHNFDLGQEATIDEDQSEFITQTFLRVDADLTDNVSTTVRLINERHWQNTNDDSSSDVDLNLAFVTLREMLYSPLTVIVGRQDFRYGNSFIMDSTGTNNSAPSDSGLSSTAGDLTKQKALDAIRIVLDYNPLTIEAFYSAIDPTTTGLTTIDDSINLWGINTTYKLGDQMDSLVEAYLFDKKDKSSIAVNQKVDHIKVVGLRGSTNPIEGLNLQAEYAFQTGTKAVFSGSTINQTRESHAMQGIVNYQLPVLKDYNPTAQYTFTKVYGNKNGLSNDTTHDNYTGWDPFFESQNGGTIFNGLFDLTNLVIHSLSLQAQPVEDITTKVSLHSLWLQNDYKTGVSTASDLINRPDTGALRSSFPIEEDESWLGKELDVDLTYDYTEDVQIGTSVGAFFPGSVFTQETDNVAKQVLVNLNVAF